MPFLVLASNNAHKLQEMKALFADTPYSIISQREAGADFEVAETGKTYRENAMLKAKAVFEATGLMTIADDSGLSVDALDGAPGIYSARFTGNHSDPDAVKNAYLLEKMSDESNRSAAFICAICCVLQNGDIIEVTGECPGEILHSPRGENGFGYDPLFKPNGFECSMAELSEEEKNRISHRGKAISALKNALSANIITKPTEEIKC